MNKLVTFSYSVENDESCLSLSVSGFSKEVIEIITALLLSASDFDIDTNFGVDPPSPLSYYSVSEIAQAMGYTASGVRKRAKGWEGGRRRKGKGGGMEYPVWALPEEWQLRVDEHSDKQDIANSQGNNKRIPSFEN